MQPQRNRDTEFTEQTLNVFYLCGLCASVVLFLLGCAKHTETQADLILHHGKVVTVDQNFSILDGDGLVDGKVLIDRDHFPVVQD